MCEDYFLFFEEVDWAIRCGDSFKLAYAPESVVYHKVGASIGTSSIVTQKSKTCDYYSVRNRMYFTKKYFPRALPTVYLTIFFAILTRITAKKMP
jgi:GT2 family glycosyltransferase